MLKWERAIAERYCGATALLDFRLTTLSVAQCGDPSWSCREGVYFSWVVSQNPNPLTWTLPLPWQGPHPDSEDWEETSSSLPCSGCDGGTFPGPECQLEVSGSRRCLARSPFD